MLADDRIVGSPTQAPRLPELTPTERYVLIGIVQGLSTKEIAKELGNSPRTVEIHSGKMLGARNRMHAAALAIGYYRMDIDVKPVER